MPAARVRHYPMVHGIPYKTDTHPIAYTAREIAQVEQIPEQLAKPVIMTADDHLVMAVLPGDRHVDLEKARKALAVTTLRLASEAEFSQAFPDCKKGAEPPFGASYDVATVVDSGLQSPRITFNAGTLIDHKHGPERLFRAGQAARRGYRYGMT